MEGSSVAERLILRFHSAPSSGTNCHVLFDGSHPAQAERYLRAVEELRRRRRSSSSNGRTLRIAMAKLEGEFRNILVSRVPDLEADFLLSDLSSLSMADSVDSGGGILSRRQGSEKFEGDEDEDEAEVEQEEEIGRTETGMTSFGLGGQSYGSTSSLVEINLVPSDVLYDLRSIAEQMTAAGYGNECSQAYGSVRKGAIEYCLQQLRVENLSVREILRLPWDNVEVKIRRWIHAVGVCVRLVFASERRLCDLVFDGLGDHDDVIGVSKEGCWSDMAFAESVKGAAFQLFGFAEAISIGERAPDRLFKIVELHDALRDLMPDVETVFLGRSLSIRRQVEEILSQLVEAVEGIFSELETAIRSHFSTAPMPGGTVHPMTRYVMNYIGLIPDYMVTLSEHIVSRPSISSFPDVEFPVDRNQLSPLSSHLLYMIAILVSNLEGKANLYTDGALSYLFVMNNLHYIVHKVKDSPELQELIGDLYPKRLTAKYQLAAMNYQRAAWIKVLHCLRDEGIHGSGVGFSSGISKSTLRERFKSFNAAFDESHRTQSAWIVPDSELKEELRISISERLLPAYRSFLGRYQQHIENGRHSELYIKYSVEGLEKAIGDLFEGSPSQLPRRRNGSMR